MAAASAGAVAGWICSGTSRSPAPRRRVSAPRHLGRVLNRCPALLWAPRRDLAQARPGRPRASAGPASAGRWVASLLAGRHGPRRQPVCRYREQLRGGGEGAESTCCGRAAGESGLKSLEKSQGVGFLLWFSLSMGLAQVRCYPCDFGSTGVLPLSALLWVEDLWRSVAVLPEIIWCFLCASYSLLIELLLGQIECNASKKKKKSCFQDKNSYNP